MGTYTASKYVTGRKPYPCGDCGAVIPKGQRHLVFKTGLRRTHRACEPCSVRLDADGHAHYYCQAVLDVIRAPGAAPPTLSEGT